MQIIWQQITQKFRGFANNWSKKAKKYTNLTFTLYSVYSFKPDSFTINLFFGWFGMHLFANVRFLIKFPNHTSISLPYHLPAFHLRSIGIHPIQPF